MASENENRKALESLTSMAGTGSGSIAQWGVEDDYWRTNYATRTYAKEGSYEALRPAYALGVSLFSQQEGKPFDALPEADLREHWEKTEKKNAHPAWEHAKQAIEDAYNRLFHKQNSHAV